MHAYRHHAGLSMIELLVALAISSFLILGVTTIYIDNKRSYAFQQNQSENIESSRYTLAILQQQLAKAGYRRRPDIPLDTTFPASSALGCNFSAGQTAKQFATSRNAICIRYQPRNDKDRDCLGNLPTNATALATGPYKEANEIIVERFFLDANALKCEALHVTSSAGATTTGELVTGLADLTFEYGVGSASNTRSVLSYTQTPAAPVLAIRYAALLRSSNPNLREGITADDALANWLSVANLGASDSITTSIKTADKGNLYFISQSAVMLRNLLP